VSGTLGTYGILLAFLAAMFGLMTAAAQKALGSDSLVRAGRWALGISAAGLTAALAALTAAFLGDQFSIQYVAEYSEKALPWGYKLAAVWAGQEGSFLLWACLIAIFAWLAAWTLRRDQADQQAPVIAVLSAVIAAFAGLMLFGHGPFAPAKQPMLDGFGLDPMLRHPAMIAHPPILFAGYAAFTVPLALLAGALISGRDDDRWVFQVRRWLLRGWALLTVGIFLGSWWAYVVLGWGGYWAWDPVENASLLPWLTATAAIHSLIVQQRKGMLRLSNALLVSATFLLCLTASYLTRGGAIESPHAFAPSSIGWFFLGVIAAGMIFMGVLIALRWRLIRSSPPLVRLVSIEGGFIGANALLTIMATTVLVGTLWALISGLFGTPRTLGKEFYNSVIVPMALCLTALMAMGPMLSSGRFTASRLLIGGLGALLHTALIAGLIVMIQQKPAALLANWMVLVAAALVGFVVAAVLDDILRTLLRPIFVTRQGGAGVWRAFRANSRRFCGMITHVGMAMVVIGVAGSSLAGPGKDLFLQAGSSEKVGPYTIRLDSFKEVRHDEKNYTAVQAATTVRTASGRAFKLTPERRYYDKAPKKPNTEIALRAGLGQDLYVILLGWQDQTAVLRVLINPMITWIWIGSILMAVAASLCVLHRQPGQSQASADGECLELSGKEARA